MTVNGTDISHWNSWPQINQYDFVFLKATESTRYVDPTFETRVGLVRAAGLVLGAYHFLTTPSPIHTQMEHFHDVAHLHSGEIAVLDFEDDETWRHMTTRALADLAREAMQWLLEAYPFNRVLLYCNRSTWLTIVKPYGVTIGDGLWIASPGQEPTMPWLFWQYGNGALDYDRGNFSGADELHHWATSKGATTELSQQQYLLDDNYYGYSETPGIAANRSSSLNQE